MRTVFSLYDIILSMYVTQRQHPLNGTVTSAFHEVTFDLMLVPVVCHICCLSSVGISRDDTHCYAADLKTSFPHLLQFKAH